MSSLEFIKQLSAGQVAEAKETLEGIISGIAFDALDEKKKEMAKCLFGDKVNEETINEESLTAGKRLVSKHGEGKYTAKVYRDPEYNEYQSHFYEDGKHMGEGPVGYHGDDKQDAQHSAESECKRMNAK